MLEVLSGRPFGVAGGELTYNQDCCRIRLTVLLFTVMDEFEIPREEESNFSIYAS